MNISSFGSGFNEGLKGWGGYNEGLKGWERV